MSDKKTQTDYFAFPTDVEQSSVTVNFQFIPAI